MNSKRILALAALVIIAASAAIAGDRSASKVDSAAAFERIKTLAGEWETVSPQMGKGWTKYEVVAGGSAVVERFRHEKAGADGEMITVYHLDGEQLVLTHYCSAKNQPRMVARSFDPATGVLRFEFLDATGLKNAAEGHMHAASFNLGSGNEFTSEWQFFENGKQKFTELSRNTRKKETL